MKREAGACLRPPPASFSRPLESSAHEIPSPMDFEARFGKLVRRPVEERDVAAPQMSVEKPR